MYAWFRPWLFRLDPEQAHNLTLNLVRWAGIFPPSRWYLKSIYKVPLRPVQALGLSFKNPVGLAAGYDKDARGINGLACLGFGHLEIGTVTLNPQPGNPKPRVFRLVEDQAVINRMGFPGQGAQRVAQRLVHQEKKDLILGVNIGKNKDTPLEMAAEEYASLVRIFAPLANYLTVNISSPNTAGLRRLQARNFLESLLTVIASARREVIEAGLVKHLPILVKLAPDLAPAELEDALATIQTTGMDGIVATNTTLSRPDLKSNLTSQTGGLSGAPLSSSSIKMVGDIVRLSRGQMPVVGVGGIMDYPYAQAMLDAGAVLVQVYTGLVYSGPGLASKIIRSLRPGP
jgi:dihydroorotate dehydrogenase